MIKAGIIGGTGVTAGELIRILLYHPSVEIDFVYSRSQAGRPVAEVHSDLWGQTDLMFVDTINPAADVVFLALGHGHSRRFLAEHTFSSATKIIDLSRDYRPGNNGNGNNSFVYGLPEMHGKSIAQATHVANPGCFATAIQLALLPLAAHQAWQGDVHVHAVTGATGAGRTLTETTAFNWRHNNLSVYKAFQHQHLDEIRENLKNLDAEVPEIHFVPMRGNFTRGIFASVYTDTEADESTVRSWYKAFYASSSFTHVLDMPVHLKQVVNTNNAFLHVAKYGPKVHITAVIDNLLKGASGQAVENMNLMFGLPQDEGLHLKAVVY